MKIIKNFLPLNQYNFLKEQIQSNEFPWYFNEYTVTPDTQFQFIHSFYYMHKQQSNLFPLINPIIELIDPALLFRVKINLNPQTSSIIETGMHKDLQDSRFKSSVLFFNTCDGYLKLKNNNPILSEDNKLVTFDSCIEHTGSTTTNEKRRIVMTIIYLPK